MRTSMILLCLLVIVAVGAAGCANVSTANTGDMAQRRTRVPSDGVPTPPSSGARPTLDTGGAQATAWALATTAAQTAGSAVEWEQTAQALLDYASMPDANPDAIVATAEAYAMMVAVDPAQVEAMVNAVLAEVPEEWYAEGTDAADLEAWLNAWAVKGNFGAQWVGDTLVATISYSETGVNALVDAAIATGAYTINDMNVDLIPGGAIVDVYGLSTDIGVSGTLSLHMLLTVVEGRIDIELVAASLNGRAVPTQKLDEVEALLEDVAGVWNEALAVVYGVSYSLNDLAITNDAFTLTLSILGLS